MPKRTLPSSDEEEEKVVKVQEEKSKDKEEKRKKKEKKEKKRLQKEKEEKKKAKEQKKEKKVETSDSESEEELEQKPKKQKVQEPVKDKKEKKKDKKKAESSDSESEEEEKPKKQKVQELAKEKKTKVNKTYTTSESDAWRAEHNLSILGDNCPAPFIQFSDATFPDYIAQAITSFKFEKPTPIQAQGWPLGIAGRDIIGIAETGSGKTLAFGIPGIIHIMSKPKKERTGPSMVVMAPTRELAQQIDEVLQKACTPCGIRTVCLFGGASKVPQSKALRQGAEIIVATPGRLIDLMDEGIAQLENVTFLVLDEADRMLDMGFQPQIRQVIRNIRKERQTLMYSATWPADVQALANTYFRDPIRITIGGESLSGAKKVTQIVEVCQEHQKKQRLNAFLEKNFKDNCKILIFMLYKATCEQMAEELKRNGYPADSLHGDKKQSSRDKVVAEFKANRCPILVATDVAARGLDIKDIKYVVNVEMPLLMEDYVHRIGRTGRAGVNGHAHTLFSPDDKVHARQLVRILEESGQKVDPALAEIASNAPITKPRKNALQQLYGDYAKDADPEMMKKKPTRITFD